MFNNNITCEKLTYAFREMYPNVSVEKLFGDNSLYVCLYKFLDRDTKLKVIEANYAEEFPKSENTIMIVNTDAMFDEEVVQKIISNMTAAGFRFNEDIRSYYKDEFNVLLFTDDNINMSVVIAERLNYRFRYHFLLATFPRLIQWICSSKIGKPPTKEQMDLLNALASTDPTKFEEIVRQIESDKEISDKYIFGKMSAMKNSYYGKQLNSIRESIVDKNNKVGAHNAAIRQLLADLRTLNSRYSALQISESSDDAGIQSFIDYLKAAKNIRVVSVNSDECVVRFKVYTYFNSWPDSAESLLDNHRSYFYRHNESSLSEDELEKLYRAVFIDETVKIKTCAEYTIGLINYEIVGTWSGEFEGMIPNPHLRHYSCLGGYSTMINECLQRGDLVGVVDACIASAGSLNIEESPTMEYFCDEATDVYNACYEYNGKMYTCVEVLKEIDK